jgi:hypothetical protein
MSRLSRSYWTRATPSMWRTPHDRSLVYVGYPGRRSWPGDLSRTVIFRCQRQRSQTDPTQIPNGGWRQPYRGWHNQSCPRASRTTPGACVQRIARSELPQQHSGHAWGRSDRGRAGGGRPAQTPPGGGRPTQTSPRGGRPAPDAAGRRPPGPDSAGRRPPGPDSAGRRPPGPDSAGRRPPGPDSAAEPVRLPVSPFPRLPSPPIPAIAECKPSGITRPAVSGARSPMGGGSCMQTAG